jgi:hypothetical protein
MHDDLLCRPPRHPNSPTPRGEGSSPASVPVRVPVPYYATCVSSAEEQAMSGPADGPLPIPEGPLQVSLDMLFADGDFDDNDWHALLDSATQRGMVNAD